MSRAAGAQDVTTVTSRLLGGGALLLRQHLAQPGPQLLVLGNLVGLLRRRGRRGLGGGLGRGGLRGGRRGLGGGGRRRGPRLAGGRLRLRRGPGGLLRFTLGQRHRQTFGNPSQALRGLSDPAKLLDSLSESPRKLRGQGRTLRILHCSALSRKMTCIVPREHYPNPTQE
ncbi:hypothetical protein DRW03_11280 [Corallococcus sp. H22C18031201]|nr:hypothetical protein DRW03_11280 [Corallococcus sp. H22C18031201]